MNRQQTLCPQAQCGFEILFGLIGLFLSVSARAQVLHIDRENTADTARGKNILAWRFNLDIDKQKRNLLEFGNALEYAHKGKKNKLLIVLLATDASFNGKAILENNGHVQIRRRDNDSKRVAPDYYMQYQWNGILGLQSRALAGCNARWNLRDKEGSDLYVSAGAFYEYEKWNPALSAYAFDTAFTQTVRRSLPRINFSGKTAFQLTDNIDLAALTFLQFPITRELSNLDQPRWFIDFNLNFDLLKHLTLILHYDHTMDFYRPLPVDVYFYALHLGVQLKI